MLNDPALRSEHVGALVELAVSNDYDGVDIDYEHFSRGIRAPQTRATEREAFSAFIAELASAMHDAGKVVTVDVPVEAGDDQPVFDYAALSTRGVDRNDQGPAGFHLRGLEPVRL